MFTSHHITPKSYLTRAALSLAAILFTVASFSAQAALVTNSKGVIWDIDDTTGNLLGAYGITIGSDPTEYTVFFEDGTTNDLFGDNYTTRFGYAYDSFMSAALAENLANALLTDVLLDETINNVNYRFDIDPELTFGCTSMFACNTRTASLNRPIDINDPNYFTYLINGITEVRDVYLTSNFDGSPADEVEIDTSTDESTTNLNQFNYAVWNTSSAPSIATAVPEPETYAMLLAGLALLGFAKRRQFV